MAIESRSQVPVNPANTTAPASPLASSQLDLSSAPAARRDCAPIDGEDGRNRANGEGHDRKKPQQKAAQEKMPAGALEAAGQVAEEGVAHLEMLELRLGKWIGKAQGQRDQASTTAPHRWNSARPIRSDGNARRDRWCGSDGNDVRDRRHIGREKSGQGGSSKLHISPSARVSRKKAA